MWCSCPKRGSDTILVLVGGCTLYGRVGGGLLSLVFNELVCEDSPLLSSIMIGIRGCWGSCGVKEDFSLLKPLEFSICGVRLTSLVFLIAWRLKCPCRSLSASSSSLVVISTAICQWNTAPVNQRVHVLVSAVTEPRVPQGSRLGDSISMHLETQVPYGSTTGDSMQHHDTQVSYGSRSSYSIHHESPTNLRCGASDICIPTISSSSDFSNGKVPKDVDNNATRKGPNSMNTRQ
ncbi:hypothetical protein VNO77_19977 [Canavalia gladiata]|uniref:Uncharacterized protein n=1 Tax=Canavalia gladiata TaxID=3824 RepID=A0AAN9QQ38_CANGL